MKGLLQDSVVGVDVRDEESDGRGGPIGGKPIASAVARCDRRGGS